MQHHTDFDPLSLIFQLENAQYGLIKCPARLNDMIVNVINRRIYGNANGEVWVPNSGPICDHLIAHKSASIAQDVYSRVGQFVPTNSQHIDKFTPIQQRFSAGEAKRTCILIDKG